eukprot:TRINITY_DN7472_c1_g1_i1.p1 TRINITY_DN7472_c1_g1~~TRINITY_DN7472_c1_g1_i1.p1  ORF type:complete len:775 (-),score=138.03 TRINITY_DN7472_c1_g1_i1:944-3268(-)
MSAMGCFCSCPHPITVTLSKQPTKLPKPASSQQPYPSHHSHVTNNNFLLSSYSKSKPLDQTLKLFKLLSHRDTITWNTVISACLRHGHFKAALHLFVEMLLLSCSHQCPDNLTFRSVLKACAEENDIRSALQIHAYIVKLQGLCSEDLILNTHLVDLYCKFGLTCVARKLFDRFPLRDVVAFAAMMTGYNEAGEYGEVLRMFKHMVECEHLAANEFVFTCALHASAALSSGIEGKQIHARIVKASMQSDAFVGTALINMYVRCNRTECGKVAFLEISEPHVASWNALMSGNSASDEVLQLFSEMRSLNVSPDHVTFACVLRACIDVCMRSVQQMHGLATKAMGIEMDVFVGGALFERYLDQGHVCDARKVYDDILDKDITASNLAIQAYVRHGHRAEAVGLFYEVLAMGREPDEVTLTSLLTRISELKQGLQFHALVLKFPVYNGSASIASSLVRMYAEFHCLDDASRVFNCIWRPDLVLWTSLISGFSQSGQSQDALKLYTLMMSEQQVEPNHYTFSSLLHSCAKLAAVGEGKQIHAQIIKSSCDVESDPFVASGLVDMYAKCGYIKEARSIFDKMPERDLASWNTMITVLGQHGYADIAMETFHELLDMPNMEPNHITFIAVLSACSRGGLVEEGYRYFQLIREPTIDHYACLIDLVGRAGQLEEARNIINDMPFDPNCHIWSSLLATSGIYGNTKMGEYSARQLLLLNPKDPGTYVALSNIYAAAGRWEDANEIRKLMKDQGIKKEPALSWLRVNGKTHIFYAEDRRCTVK